MDVGILGGTGPAGQALAARLASVGYDVTVGSRDEEKAATVCAALKAKWPAFDLRLEPATNEGAAKATLIVVGTQWAAAEPTVASVVGALGGKVVISMGNALAMVGGELVPVTLPSGSVAAAVQAAAPDALVAAAFQHVPARELGRIDRPMEGDVLICTDHAEALEVTSALVRAIPALRPLPAGSLALAGTVEAFTAVLVRFRKASLRLTGIDRAGLTVRFFDTAQGEVVDFSPGPVVTMYTCGITPYDATHIGHAATYLLYDVLQRRMRDEGYRTLCVRNVTDVDDDLLRKARELGMNYLDLAAREVAKFDGDMKALGMLPAFSEPRATSAIHDILGFVGMVLDRGHAYQAGGGVYFDVASFPQFGQVSHLDRDEMLKLAAERGGNPDDPVKRDPLDFVLWQPSAPDEPAWPSQWGPGRPGWHIECSALALRELGTSIDLHGGGSDLIYPHHECEAAQSEAAIGERFVRRWLHAPMVELDGVKMSKSLGNLVFVSELVQAWDPMAVRLAILDHSYRGPWAWHEGLLPVATDRLARWRATGDGDAALDNVRAAIDDDLDFPRAIAAIDRAAAAGHGVSAAAGLLGVNLTST